VEDRVAPFWGKKLWAAVAAQFRRPLILDKGEVTGDLVWNMVEVPTGTGARGYGRRVAQSRALRAATATSRAEQVEATE